ncbi:P-loop containing nucleoside triphosphate hydrolase protein [Aspergillus multicolor]|uniref:putative dynamin GTPase n=1 Tax=Aspergillus multicolor TaxID=41759 RepID=UPI003CCD3AFA
MKSLTLTSKDSGVVCGDQSAGKSSVLEGISGIPFPRQDGLCTRFATEIVLRHNPHANCLTFGHFSELPGIIEAAGQVMELVGDTGLHLIIINLPGLILVSEDERDVQMVSDLVDRYLESSRTIVLAVARCYDKDGVRTVGIITKPDFINTGTEQRVARLAKNLDCTKLNLGFFLLKNPAPAELQQDFSPAARRCLDLGLNPACIRIKNLRISADFQALVRAGVDGDYNRRDASFFNAKVKTLANRLRALIHQENEKFANYMRDHGQTRKIICNKYNESTSLDGMEFKEEMTAWIKQTRGRELPGNYNHSLLAELFHSQSIRWGKIARDHLNAVAALVSSFLQAALEFVIKDAKVCQSVQNCVSKSVQGDTQRAINKLGRLLEDEARQPIIYNYYYTDNVIIDMTKQACCEAQNNLSAYYKLPAVFKPVLMAAESPRVSFRRDEARHLQQILERSLDNLSI